MTNGAAFASVRGIERFIKRGERLGNGIGGVFVAGEGRAFITSRRVRMMSGLCVGVESARPWVGYAESRADFKSDIADVHSATSAAVAIRRILCWPAAWAFLWAASVSSSRVLDLYYP
jgi:hypothetical protein